MKNIQMTIDEPLLERMDEAAERLKMARSAFIREAVEKRLDDLQEAEWDRQHREAYERMPLTAEELADFEAMQKLQDWGEPWEPKAS
ncbi:MAG: ribbon-helix-helix domain-containing protein [Tepidiformaceae bacterium]